MIKDQERIVVEPEKEAETFSGSFNNVDFLLQCTPPREPTETGGSEIDIGMPLSEYLEQMAKRRRE